MIQVFTVSGERFRSAVQKMGRGTVAWLAVAAAVAIVLGCADAKITVEDSFYRY